MGNSTVPEELTSLQRRLTSEMRAETRAALKSEQYTIAAIDEQLWLTDQRLGQRIDEIAHAQERTAVLVHEDRGSDAWRTWKAGGDILHVSPKSDKAVSGSNHLTEAEQLERFHSARKVIVETSAEEAAHFGGRRESSSRDLRHS